MADRSDMTSSDDRRCGGSGGREAVTPSCICPSCAIMRAHGFGKSTGSVEVANGRAGYDMMSFGCGLLVLNRSLSGVGFGRCGRYGYFFCH
jgi:hypothetical protein